MSNHKTSKKPQKKPSQPELSPQVDANVRFQNQSIPLFQKKLFKIEFKYRVDSGAVSWTQADYPEKGYRQYTRNSIYVLAGDFDEACEVINKMPHKRYGNYELTSCIERVEELEIPVYMMAKGKVFVDDGSAFVI